MPYPYEFSKNQLLKVGAFLVNEKQLQLQCVACRAVWSVVKRGLRLPKGYWKCPNGCNANKVSARRAPSPSATVGDECD
jgi:hypothetical protein